MEEISLIEDLASFGEQPIPDVDMNGGGAWTALMAGTLGWMLGHNRKTGSTFSIKTWGQESEYSEEEFLFLIELWKLEKELKSSMEREDWYRAYLLVHLAVEATKNDWSEFIPGNQGYARTFKFEGEVCNMLQHFLQLCQSAIKLDHQSLLPERMETPGKTVEVYLDFDTMELSIDGEIQERKGGGEAKE
jgi:hypothetical protein